MIYRRAVTIQPIVLAAGLVASAAAPSPGLALAEKPPVKPDFSAVKSRAAAEALVRRGRLVKILLFPAEFGGEDRRENTVYITPEAASARDLIIGTLQRFAAQGLIDKLDVVPEYKGDSFVPSRIVMHATHGKKRAAFDPTIDVW